MKSKKTNRELRAEKLNEQVAKLIVEGVTHDTVMNFSYALWRATQFGEGLSWPEVDMIVKHQLKVAEDVKNVLNRK